ncbi:hypothetical protein jhhlp_004812 [Lomentospora prolificans]|uniref:Zn(2)-C6 fungal-type domain-containing protein n=1 Tax=Lomentospora prolificans TaxID=41688 RepID=A0A2N3N8I8_9PEZI|nr:hypothetical protein jhhlp_004812 [Lomentospora prolificans]
MAHVNIDRDSIPEAFEQRGVSGTSEVLDLRENRRKGDETTTPGRVFVACTICRSQHLRCDAATPSCSRCSSLGKKCVYVDIRRPRRKRRGRGSLAAGQNDQPNNAVSGLDVDNTTSAESVEPQAGRAQALNGSISTGFDVLDVSEINFSATLCAISSDALLTSRPLDGFYASFFPSHPFVLPQAQLIERFSLDPDPLSGTIAVITFIGSLYLRDGQSDRLWQDAEGLLQKELPSTGFSVQALLLLALCLEWRGEDERASGALERAKTVALTIGMNRQQFAVEHGQGDEVLEESWRRTWWELYVVDALFAGIRHWPTFSLWSVETDTLLPAEEGSYIAGSIPQPRSLHDYDNRCFEDEDEAFTSFTYLIDVARILGTALAAGDIAGGTPSSLAKNAEANIMSWELHLPSDKRDPVRSNGTVDEVLFRAHLMINAVAVHLHRPRSELNYCTMEILCSKYAPPLPAEVLQPEERSYNRHTHKAVGAAAAFIDLLSVSSRPTSHSPFIMCMGSMAVTTYLSACESGWGGSERTFSRDRVRVFLGVLKAFDDIWPQAAKWSREIKLMARAIFDNQIAGQLVMEVPAVAATADNEIFAEAGDDIFT